MSRLGRQGYLRLDIKANHNKSESFKWGCLRVVSLKMSVSMDFSIFTRFAYPLNNGGMVFVLPGIREQSKGRTDHVRCNRLRSVGNEYNGINSG